MAKNLVVCSDGTGNTFDSRVTNVTRLIKNLVVDQTDHQVVIYDQGVGTTKKREQQTRVEQVEGLVRLEAPASSPWNPAAIVRNARGLAFGYGLEENLRQMYRALALRYEEGDRLFLFGFSRGAFTVRALAGLLHRCHLPRAGATDVDQRFDRSWALFQPMIADRQAVEALRSDHQPCPVHFLGVWDTVKSYGGIRPVILPHLRHNPDVAHVRHALAIEERRAWFKPTTWGLLDSDRTGAMTRLDPADEASYRQQDIAEVWFTGSHSDVGGGGPETPPSRVALRWMLAEAAAVDPPILVSSQGWQLIGSDDPEQRPLPVKSSFKLSWRAMEQIPRKEIDNSGIYPRLVAHRGSDGVREPDTSQREGQVTVHETVSDRTAFQAPVREVTTRTPARPV